MTIAGKKIIGIVKAFRIRTLFLSLACISAGGLITLYYNSFNSGIFILTLVTTVFLQILSNLANDYGDAVKGTDNINRVGPLRAVQSGEVSLQEMKILTIIFTILSFVSGLTLIFISIPDNMLLYTLLFVVVGIVAIWAAIKYTVGKKAYGYSGLGDLFVFLFFGIVGVTGSFFLQALEFNSEIFLISTAFGLLSVAVLNLNNMRDVVNDSACGKRTLPVRIGVDNAKYYHSILILFSWLCLLSFSLIHNANWSSYLYLILIPFFAIHIRVVFRRQGAALNPLLGQLSVLTFLLSVFFVASNLL